MASPNTTLRLRALAPLQDTQLRANFRNAMDGLMDKRARVFADDGECERMRSLGESVRRRALAKLPDLLEELESKCTANGIQVHWAETVDDANRIVLDILQRRGVTSVLKGKSMVSEEMHLNKVLGDHGILALEADLGEYIVQMAGETPSHIIMPAIHKNRKQIALLFERHIPGFQYTEDPKELTTAAREVLRKMFAKAGAGMTGVNCAVAETGTLCLVENEGNGRMVSTVPPLHIAVTGIDKIVEKLEDVPPILSLLTRSATGQEITTYVNMITSPRKKGERDGPDEVHLILLDNGRSRIYRDGETRQTLQCIRCGACMNHCPVYTRIGGQAYGGVYPGPIGKILTPQLAGLHVCGDMPGASSLCNACVEVCPVKIPITRLLVRLREEVVGPQKGGSVKDCEGQSSKLEDLAWHGWAKMHASPSAYKVLTTTLAKTGNLAPSFVPMLRQWTSVRSKPKFAGETLHQLVKKNGVCDV